MNTANPSPPRQRRPAMGSVKVTAKKASFRRWCSSMRLNAMQAAAIFDLSRPNLYKYLDEEQPLQVRGVVVLTCNLLNMLPAEQRDAVIRERLKAAKVTDVWPAEQPVDTVAPARPPRKPRKPRAKKSAA